jgi:hypothetical protein
VMLWIADRREIGKEGLCHCGCRTSHEDGLSKYVE